MKRVGYLYEKIYDIDNCRQAIIEAADDKRKRRRVKYILEHLDEYAGKLSEMIKNKTYEPSPFAVRYINDGIKQKRRRLAKPAFWPDQCVHHAADRVVAPILEKRMYEYCTGSIKGRGGAMSQRGIELYRKRYPQKAKYVYKNDIHHCYDTILHEWCKEVLRRYIKDEDVLWLYGVFIDAYPRLAQLKNEPQLPEDRGIPVGTDPARWLCNISLTDIDFEVKQFLGKDYFMTRYVDDTVICGPNKRKLRKAHKIYETRLAEREMSLKDNWQIYRLDSRPIDFVGYKFYKDHTTIRKSILKRIKRKLKKAEPEQKASFSTAAGLMSYMGWVKNSDSQYFRDNYIKDKVSLKKIRKVVSKHETGIQRKTISNVAGNSKC